MLLLPPPLVVLLLLTAAHAQPWIAQEVQGVWDFAAQTIPGDRSPQCARSIQHLRVAKWRNLAPGAAPWAARWRDMIIDGANCTRSPTPATATVFTPPPADTGFAPFFLLGVDNARRQCGPAFDQRHPARYYFTKDLPRYRDTLEDTRFIAPSLRYSAVEEAEEGQRFMMARQFVRAAGGDAESAVVCTYKKRLPTLSPSVTPSPSPSPAEVQKERRKCFPGSAVVDTKHRGFVQIRDLNVGDEVRVDARSFSPVFFFSHRDSDARQQLFVDIRFDSNHSLMLSHGHYTRLADGTLRAAANVRVGDAMRVAPRDACAAAAQLHVARVVSVQESVADGLFAPHTLAGDLVVNGVLVSSYTTAVAPVAAHRLLAPLRALWRCCGVALAVPDTRLQGAARVASSVAQTLQYFGMAS